MHCSASDAAHRLTERGDDAKIVADGQSLMPTLAFRLARPTALVDFNNATDLGCAQRDGDVLHVGCDDLASNLGYK